MAASLQILAVLAAVRELVRLAFHRAEAMSDVVRR